MERRYNVTAATPAMSVLIIALTLIFVIGKGFGLGVFATWSWWVVFIPVWGPIVALTVLIVLAGIIYGLGKLLFALGRKLGKR